MKETAESTSVLAQDHAREGTAMAKSIVGITLVLLLLGIIMVYSSSGVHAGETQGDPTFFLKRQALWSVLGLPVLFALSLIPYRSWRGLAPLVLFLSLFALAVVAFTPLGREMNGARRWLAIGPLQFEPSAAAMIAMILFLASRLASRGASTRTGIRGFAGLLLVVCVACGLLMRQPDFGTSVLIVLVTAALFFLDGMRKRELAATVIVAVLGGAVAILTSDYRMGRVHGFLNPWQNAQGSAYQIVQSMIAFGSGGVFGQGLGFGLQKLGYIPKLHTDFVLAVVGEELGFVGVASLTVLYALLVVQGMRISIRAEDRFGLLLAAGLSLLLGLQAAINMGMTLALLPTKGLPLPFLSYGGSALVADAGAVGILLSIARAKGRAMEAPVAIVGTGER